MSYVLVGKVTDFWIGEVKEVLAGERRILMVRAADGLHAYQGECPHQGVPLCDGQLDGNILSCAAHQWQFDIQTGQGVNPDNIALEKIPMRLEGDEVWVDDGGRARESDVGPTVNADKMGRAIAAAISEQNAGAKITDRGSYLRIEAPSPCRLSRGLLEKYLERPVQFPEDIELAMSSFKGRIFVETEQIVWSIDGGRR